MKYEKRIDFYCIYFKFHFSMFHNILFYLIPLHIRPIFDSKNLI